MNRDEFEAKILELWMKSRVPLTQANLQYFAQVPRKKLNKWIDELLDDGLLDIDVSEDGELQYTVPGARRSADGPSTAEAYERKREMVAEAKRRILARRAGKSIQTKSKKSSENAKPSTSLRLFSKKDTSEQASEDEDDTGVVEMVSKAAFLAGSKALVALDKPLSMLDKPVLKGDKSLIASAGLSLFGPVGWLYAGSFREAIPATLAYAAVGAILPSFILTPFLLVGMFASSAVGLTYAWQFNRKKRRTTLFLKAKNKDEEEE